MNIQSSRKFVIDPGIGSSCEFHLFVTKNVDMLVFRTIVLKLHELLEKKINSRKKYILYHNFYDTATTKDFTIFLAAFDSCEREDAAKKV